MPTNSPSPKRSLRILVVEDEFLVATDIADMLEEMGYQVIGPAPTVLAAIHLIASENPDAALLDANLAGTSSAPIAAELAKRNLPFVVVTGYGNMALGSAELQAAPRVHKPFSQAEITAALAKTLVA